MNKGKVNQISGGQLLFLLVLFRLASLLFTTSMSYVFLLSEAVVTIAFSLLVFKLDKAGVKAQKRAALIPLSLLLLVLVFLDIKDYFIFTEKVSHSDVSIWLIIGILVLFSVYCGMLGTEAVARFSALGLIIVLVCVIVAITTNIKEFRTDFLAYPQNKNVDAISLLRCLDVPLVFLLLAPKTADKKARALAVGSTAPYLLIFAVVLMCRAIMGRTAEIYKSPVFALFQLGEIGSFTKLDILYICAVLILLLSEISIAVSIILGERRLRK